jgi:broad specificity phosphatase PhoE
VTVRLRRWVTAMGVAMALGLPARVGAQHLVVLVRHAEQADVVPANGSALSSVDPPLSGAGQARAVTLADMLSTAGITAIYSSEYRRAQDTARPLAARIGVPLQIAPSTAGPALVNRIRSEEADGIVLIVGHSNTLGDFMRAFGLASPPVIAEDEYDKIFVVVPASGTLMTLTYPPSLPPDTPAG